MKTKLILGDEHLVKCNYDKYNGLKDSFVIECNCFLNAGFREYFINKYPKHLATIAYRDRASMCEFEINNGLFIFKAPDSIFDDCKSNFMANIERIFNKMYDDVHKGQ